MKCPICDFEREEVFTVCPKCGVVQEAPEVKPAYSSGYRRLSPKKLKRFCIAIAVVILAVAALIILGVNSGKRSTKENSLVYYENQDGSYVFVFDGEKSVKVGEELSSAVKRVEKSYSERYAILLTMADELYLVSRDGCRKFDDADDVKHFITAPLCDKILYIKEYDEVLGGKLFECSVSSPSRSKLVAENVFYDGGGLVYSPNGEAFSYTLNYLQGVSWSVKVVKSGSFKEISEYSSVKVSALSDNGKYVYYTDAAGNFSLSGKIIFSNTSSLSSEYYSADGKEALLSVLSDSENRIIFIKGGKTVVKDVSGAVGKLLFPEKYFSNDLRFINTDSFIKRGLSIFNESGEEEYYYIEDKELSLKKISPLSGIDVGGTKGEIYIADDCETVYYRKADQTNIKYIKIYDYNSGAKELSLGVKVESFKVSESGEYIYFKGIDGKLYFVKDKTAKKVAESVYGNEYYITEKGGVYYGGDYSGGTMNLYYSKKGGSPKPVKGISGSPQRVYTFEYADAYFVQTEFGFYRLNSTSSKLISKIDAD